MVEEGRLVACGWGWGGSNLVSSVGEVTAKLLCETRTGGWRNCAVSDLRESVGTGLRAGY